MRLEQFMISLLLIVPIVVYAENQDCTVNGNQNVSCNKAGHDINIGISDETVKKIIAVFESQHKADAEQIKQYKQMLEDLRSGKVDAPPAAIQAAFAALEKGDASLAESLFEKSVEEELKKAADSNKNAAKALRNLGTLRWWDSQKAIAAYQRATALDPDDADGWNQLATLFLRVGELDQAIVAYQTVLKLGQAHQDQQEVAAAYGNLGIVYDIRGELDKAVEMQQKSLQFNEAISNKAGMAAVYGNLGLVYKTRGELDKAVEMYNKALAINQALGNKEGMAQNYGNLGIVYQQTLSELDKAIEMHNKALELNRALDRKEGMAVNYGNLGTAYRIGGTLDKAIEMNQKSLTITESLGDKEKIATVSANLGAIYKQKGNQAEAKRYYQKAIELFKYLKSPNEKVVQKWLDDLK